MDTGNPWVFLGSSVPISVHTRTLEPWVQVWMGLASGMGMGTKVPEWYGYGFTYIRYIYLT